MTGTISVFTRRNCKVKEANFSSKFDLQMLMDILTTEYAKYGDYGVYFVVRFDDKNID